MKKVILYFLAGFSMYTVSAQSTKTELYDLIKKLIPDSSAYESVGDWSLGDPKKSPIKWQSDRIEMSDDTSINFFRRGTVDITIKGRSLIQQGNLVKWNIMLKGPRMGYTSFSIISSPSSELQSQYNIDSIFGKKPFTAKLLKNCNTKTITGFNYYELKLPKKQIVYLKLSWITINGAIALRIDCFDGWSQYAAKLDCPR